MPAPAVTSAVIACPLRQEPPVAVESEKLFFRTVKAAFAQRRKTLLNTLRTTGLAKEVLVAMLAEAGIDGQRRGETLTLEEFAALANAWWRHEENR